MNQVIDSAVKFREEQRFRQKWLQIGIGAVSLLLMALFGYGMIRQLVLRQPWGDRPMSDTALTIVGTLVILMAVGLAWLFHKMKLITVVRADGVYIHFVPLVRKAVLFTNMAGCEVRTYRPVRDYGIWGVRYGRAGKAYNVSGNRGVQLKLVDGEKLLIGSQRPEELARAIQAQMKK